MFLSKKTFILFTAIGLTLVPLHLAFAQKTDATPQNNNNIAVKKTVPKTKSSYELGLSYFMWNEKLVVTNGIQSTEGFANYAGFGINLEKNWTTSRWFRGATISYMFGKASSGGFDTTPTFVDGINRSWQAIQLSAFSLYRFDTTFSAGGGLLVLQRDADWIPKDNTVTVIPSASNQVGGQILMRWQVANRLALLQTYTLLNFSGSSMWTWSARLSL